MPAGKPAGRTGDVILISKPLRMEWTDAMAHDPALSHVAYRVASVIGSYLNRQSGNAFVSQATISRVMELSRMTVWTAIAELERRGYLIVKARELGARASDGRRVRGGRGAANSYLPAIDKTQVSVTYNGRKLVEQVDRAWQRSYSTVTFDAGKVTNGCDLSEPERSQKPDRKVTADCDPTLEKSNPLSARARGEGLGLLGDMLQARIGAVPFRAWFAGVEIEALDECELRLSVPSRFVRNYVRANFGDIILSTGKESLHSSLERVEMTVRAEAQPEAHNGRVRVRARKTSEATGRPSPVVAEEGEASAEAPAEWLLSAKVI